MLKSKKGASAPFFFAIKEALCLKYYTALLLPVIFRIHEYCLPYGSF